ncbi:MAG: glutamate formimidoyltransferase [Bacteroidales bacterium]|nr:glutamate formimidoyltransferase [Bacteroidales bacterium]
MKRRIIEAVPNFSEGRNRDVIDGIVAAIAEVDGVKILHVDQGYGANRTVVTFAGEPQAVAEGAFRGTKRAAELIDMRCHKGAHPRIGATDVLPLVPVEGVSLQECVDLARGLSKRIADELHIPVYCYEAASFKAEHKNLADCRRGEYESLPQRLSCDGDNPDFGLRPYDEQIARTGASVVGARDFLLAVNFNLDTKSVPLANAIAFDVREKGRLKYDADGKPVRIPGSLKGTKALGWYIEEYGIAQVSMNIVDIEQAPLHKVYEEVKRAAAERGVVVTGTEIIGLMPLRLLLNAGRYFMQKDGRCTDSASDEELINYAVNAMALDDLRPFEPNEKVIEYRL